MAILLCKGKGRSVTTQCICTLKSDYCAVSKKNERTVCFVVGWGQGGIFTGILASLLEPLHFVAEYETGMKQLIFLL